jgi:Xaa-Pro dipeptidase
MDLDELKKLYQAHVAELQASYGAALEAGGFDAIAIHSGKAVLRTRFDDAYWPLRPTPYFQHWLPLVEPDCALVIAPGQEKPKLLRPRQLNYWEQPAAPETDHFWDSLEVVELARPDEVRYHLRGRVAFIGDDLQAAQAWGLSSELANWDLLLATLDQLRVKKTPYEVYCLAEANRRAALGHETLKKAFFDGDQAELDLHLLYLSTTRQYDGDTPYQNIVALDAHAATLHHVAYGKRAAPAQSLLLDAGATFAGYCSDVTRTWVKGASAQAESFKELVAGVERLQQRSCDNVTLYKPYEELHDEAHLMVAGVLRELGISKLSAEELAETGITRAFFPHGLGHSLGLQCHDVGCAVVKPKAENPFLRNTTQIGAGQVFTIEPGIYFIDGLLKPLREGKRSGDINWEMVDALAPLGGVRIEDDVVVGAEGEGLRNLTREVLP